jgi:hypothetical protein
MPPVTGLLTSTPEWSPDGELLALETFRGVVTLDKEGHEHIVAPWAHRGAALSWSRSGALLIVKGKQVAVSPDGRSPAHTLFTLPGANWTLYRVYAY